MTILVTGSTGTIGSQVVQRLARQSVRTRALVRDDASKVKVPAGVEPVQGDMTDVASMRAVLKGVDTLFLLNAAVPDETTQALGHSTSRARPASGGSSTFRYSTTPCSTKCRPLQASTSSSGPSTPRPFPLRCSGRLPSCRTI